MRNGWTYRRQPGQPVRKMGRQTCTMTDDQRLRLIPKKRLRPYSGRGKTYAWLRAHHARIAELRDGERPWADIIAEMVDHAGAGPDDDRPTLKSISGVWARVCRDVEVEAATKTAKSKPPCRMSPEWRPQEVIPPPPIRPAAPAVPDPVLSPEKRNGVELTPEETQAVIDRALDRLGQRDRDKFRFGG